LKLTPNGLRAREGRETNANGLRANEGRETKALNFKPNTNLKEIFEPSN
jgi:hypothetical protein